MNTPIAGWKEAMEQQRSRTINVGGNQGRGDPPASQWDTSAIENPRSMLANPWFWIGAVVAGLLWSAAYVALEFLHP